MSKLIIEVEFDESWDAYTPDSKSRINDIFKPMLEGVKIKILEDE